MAWNMTARATAVRAFTSGGARGTVASMDTSKLFQAMTGTMFAGELRQQLEHFEPYGLTSAIINKNVDGVAEAAMSYLTGSRGHAIASVIGDRRYRPLGLKQGETAQYDDIGQMNLIRRIGTFMLSLDGPGGANAQTPGADNQNRMVSMRHVVKSKQPRTPMSSGQAVGDGSQLSQTQDQSQEFKHEGEQVNTEIRATAQQIQIFDQETVVAVYDRQSKKWTFTAGSEIDINAPTINIKADTTCVVDSPKIKLGSKNASIPVKLCDDSCALKVFAE